MEQCASEATSDCDATSLNDINWRTRATIKADMEKILSMKRPLASTTNLSMSEGSRLEEPEEEQVDLHDPVAVQARIQQLKQIIVELDGKAQIFKLLGEKQAAEINAKELLLTRKTEYVDELLEQIRSLTSKLDAKTTEAQALELKAQKVNGQIQELKEQVKKDEEDFAMVCAALDAREQTLTKKNGELLSAVETERQLKKELERQQGTIRRLEKNVEDLQPEKADACLSPRSFHENQLIRLRDDAIEAKTREVWLLSGQNDQLRVQLDELEAALEQLQRNIISKENDLVRRQRKIDRLEAEVDALQVSRNQADGREKAMEIATVQNEKLLQALEAQERNTEELKVRLEDSERECEQLRSSHHDHIARSAESEVEVLHRTRQAEEKASAVTALQEKVRRERKFLQEELSSSHLNYQMEIEKVQNELVMRRNKQYELTLKLQDVENRLHEALGRRECAEEQLLAAQCRMQELERVLQDSLDWKKQLENELALHKKISAEDTDKQSKVLSGAKRELAALQKQLEEMKETLNKRLIAEKQQELRHRETKQLLEKHEALTIEQKQRIHRLVKDVNRESQARAAVELERNLLKSQLEALRQQTESSIRELLEQKNQVQDKRQQLAGKFTELTTEFHALQNAKSRLVHKFADAFARASACVVWPSDCLEIRECWLEDDDLRPILKMLEGEGGVRLQRIDMRCNHLTSKGMMCLLVFLKKLVVGLVSETSRARIRELDLRQNCISLDGVRVVAKGIESLVSSKSNNGVHGLKSVAVSDDGRVEVYSVANVSPVLIIDISENVDADWLVAESRRFQAQYRRGKELNSSNNRSNAGGAQLLNDALSTSDKSLQEIYGLDLVKAFMGEDKELKGGAIRRKSITEIPAGSLTPATLTPRGSLRKRVGTASPRGDDGVGRSISQLPVVAGCTRDSGMSPRLSSSLSLPRLLG